MLFCFLKCKPHSVALKMHHCHFFLDFSELDVKASGARLNNWWKSFNGVQKIQLFVQLIQYTPLAFSVVVAREIKSLPIDWCSHNYKWLHWKRCWLIAENEEKMENSPAKAISKETNSSNQSTTLRATNKITDSCRYSNTYKDRGLCHDVAFFILFPFNAIKRNTQTIYGKAHFYDCSNVFWCNNNNNQ